MQSGDARAWDAHADALGRAGAVVGATNAMNSHLQWQWHNGLCSYTEARMLEFEDCHSQMRRCSRPGSEPVSLVASGFDRRCNSTRAPVVTELEKDWRICWLRSSNPVAQESSRLGSETPLLKTLMMPDAHQGAEE